MRAEGTANEGGTARVAGEAARSSALSAGSGDASQGIGPKSGNKSGSGCLPEVGRGVRRVAGEEVRGAAGEKVRGVVRERTTGVAGRETGGAVMQRTAGVAREEATGVVRERTDGLVGKRKAKEGDKKVDATETKCRKVLGGEKSEAEGGCSEEKGGVTVGRWRGRSRRC